MNERQVCYETPLGERRRPTSLKSQSWSGPDRVRKDHLMSKYTFLNVPAHGHVNPTLAVAQELVRRGEQVVYYLTEEFRAAVEATGATFRPYQSIMGKMQQPAGPITGKGGIGPGAMPLMMAQESRQVLPQVLESMRAEQPDYLLYDPMCLWGYVAAQVLRLPAIVLRSSYAVNEQFNPFTARGAGSQRFQLNCW